MPVQPHDASWHDAVPMISSCIRHVLTSQPVSPADIVGDPMRRTVTLLALALTMLLFLATGCARTAEPAQITEPTAAAATLEPTPTEPEPAEVTEPVEKAEGDVLSPAWPNLAEEARTRKAAIDAILELIERPSDGDAVATVNGVDITLEEYVTFLRLQLDSLASQYGVDWSEPEMQTLLQDIESEALDQLIDMALMEQFAEAEEIYLDEVEIAGYMREVQQSIVQGHGYSSWEEYQDTLDLSDAAFERIIRQTLLIQLLIESRKVEQEMEQVHARHILVADPEIADDIVARLDDGEDFGELAREYSQDPGSANQGGDLGWFPRGVMLQEFEEAAFDLEPGETSPIVTSLYGLHIIQVLDKDTVALSPVYVRQFQERAFAEWLWEAHEQAEIERHILVPVG